MTRRRSATEAKSDPPAVICVECYWELQRGSPHRQRLGLEWPGYLVNGTPQSSEQAFTSQTPAHSSCLPFELAKWALISVIFSDKLTHRRIFTAGGPLRSNGRKDKKPIAGREVSPGDGDGQEYLRLAWSSLGERRVGRDKSSDWSGRPRGG